MNSRSANQKPRVLIAGGGIAGLEAMMAIRDHAGERANITLVAPDSDFVYKPLIVEEPFSSQPAEQHALAPIAEGVRRAVRPAAGHRGAAECAHGRAG